MTANVDDFLKLAHARDVHPGIIMLEDGAATRDQQLRYVRAAIAALAGVGAVTNKVLWVAPDESTTVEDIPPL